MTTMIAEVYDALREAGASEGKSRAAAEALSAYETRFVGIDRRFDALDHRLEQRFSELDQKIDRFRVELGARIDRQDARLTFQQGQLALLMGGVASLVIKAFFTGAH